MFCFGFDSLQRLSLAVNRLVADLDIRQILTDSLAFENDDSKCNRVIRHLKARSPPTDEWIRNTADSGSLMMLLR